MCGVRTGFDPRRSRDLGCGVVDSLPYGRSRWHTSGLACAKPGIGPAWGPHIDRRRPENRIGKPTLTVRPERVQNRCGSPASLSGLSRARPAQPSSAPLLRSRKRPAKRGIRCAGSGQGSTTVPPGTFVLSCRQLIVLGHAASHREARRAPAMPLRANREAVSPPHVWAIESSKHALI
jgi:hypothetical protein